MAKKADKATQKEVKNLLEMFEYFLTQRELGKPIDEIGEAVKDLRILIGRLISDHFMDITKTQEAKFCSSLATLLSDRASEFPAEDKADRKYYDYCIGQIMASFEEASSIKKAHPGDPVLQKMLALDIPILRPFDYGLRGRLAVVTPKKKKKVYG